MKRTTTLHWLFLAMLLMSNLFSTNVKAATFKAAKTGLWQATDTWSPAGVPGVGDTVVIDGFIVSTNLATGNLNVSSIEIINTDNIGSSILKLAGDDTLTVTGNMHVTALDIAQPVELLFYIKSNLVVEGNLLYSRAVGNAQASPLRLYMQDTTSFLVKGAFSFFYGDSQGEGMDDIALEGNAALEVEGDVGLYMINGAGFDLSLKGTSSALFHSDVLFQQDDGANAEIEVFDMASLLVKEDLTLKNNGGALTALKAYGFAEITIDSNLIMTSVTDMDVNLVISSAMAKVEVKEDVVMSAEQAGDVEINMFGGGEFSLGGNFSLPTNYGALNMGADATLIYNGTEPQVIASGDVAGNGADDFTFTNVKFDNSSGAPLTLAGPMVVTDTMELINGIINTGATNTLTIADGANIIGGNPNAYINGAMTKIGTTGVAGSIFTFPIGNGGTYAPVSIDTLYGPTDQYKVTYMNCPPPFGNNISDGLNLSHISSLEYWVVEKTAGTPDVDIWLHWMDSNASGIDNLDSLVVAFYDMSATEWIPLGNGEMASTSGPGGLNSLATNCPPPFGNGVQNMLTFGSTFSGFNALPVDLLSFTAEVVDKDVALDWVATNGEDNDYFVVEKSLNGTSFETIGTVEILGSAGENKQYSLMDKEPAKGFNYYRLKQVDTDGRFYYSEIVTISMKKAGAPIIFPNPVKGHMNIYMNGVSQKEAEVEIFNESGVRLFYRRYPVQGSVFQIASSDIQNLINGTYTITIKNEYETHSLRFLKIE